MNESQDTDAQSLELEPSEERSSTAPLESNKPEDKKPASSGLLSRIKTLLSNDRPGSDELVSEADQIYARMDQVDGEIAKLVDAQILLTKYLEKEMKQLVKLMDKNQTNHLSDTEKILERLRNDVKKQSSGVAQLESSVLTKMDSTLGAVSGVNDSLKGIRGFLDENSQMVKRFEEGYDYQILKNFVRQIARSIKNLEQQIDRCTDQTSKEELEDARYDMVEMLERNGIRQIVPSIGGAYDGLEQLVEVSGDKVPTTDPSMVGKIAEVECVGYRYEFNDSQQRLIQAARVKLYE